MPASRLLTSSQQAVRLLDAASGGQEWQFGPVAANTSCVVVKGPTPSADHLYVGTADGWVYKLSFETGAQLAKFAVGGTAWGLAYADGVVYVNAGTTLQAHHATAGLLWTQNMGDLAWGNPVVANGIVYSGSWDGKLYAVDVNGSPAWISTAFNYFAAEPTVVDGVVYVATLTEQLVALDAATGAVIWQAQSSNKANIVDPVTVANGRVYAGTHWGGLLCSFDAATGVEQWSVSVGGHPAVALYRDGRIYVATEHGAGPGYLRAFDAGSGMLLWTSQTPTGSAGDAVSRPAADEGTNTAFAFVTSQDGHAYAFDRDTGGSAWKVAIGTGWPVDPAWTDAQGSLVPHDHRYYAAIDPLALVLRGDIYVKINLPYPQPVEVLAARVRKMAGGMNRAEKNDALAQLKSLDTVARMMQQAIRKAGVRSGRQARYRTEVPVPAGGAPRE
ncbi:MAG TPA: PQQ-binding-like beta-propeller repeat protein [Longimicrobiales bacterium]|nr:PQQ-binding-like beta-propeller repeat protein [Longimicrobiales bacterium]